MNYQLNLEKERVGFLLKTGIDMVKSEMSLAFAQEIIRKGNVKASQIPDYPINVDDKWFFEGIKVRGMK